MVQIDRLKKVAVDGKVERLQNEKRRMEWLAGAANRRQDLAVHSQKMRARQVRRSQMGYTDDLSSSEEECYDLCYDNVSNGGASRHLEYDEKMEQQFSGSQYANVTDFSNMY